MKYLVEMHKNNKWIISDFIDGMSVTDGVLHFIVTPDDFLDIGEALNYGKKTILSNIEERKNLAEKNQQKLSEYSKTSKKIEGF